MCSADLQARIRIIGEMKGRRAALRYIEYVEEALIDEETLDKIVLIRGEEARRESALNRRRALAWFRQLHPLWLRAANRRT